MQHKDEQHGCYAEQLDVRLAGTLYGVGSCVHGHEGECALQRYAFLLREVLQRGRKKSRQPRQGQPGQPGSVSMLFGLYGLVEERDSGRDVGKVRTEVRVQHAAGRVFDVESDAMELDLPHEVDGDGRLMDVLEHAVMLFAVEGVVRLQRGVGVYVQDGSQRISEIPAEVLGIAEWEREAEYLDAREVDVGAVGVGGEADAVSIHDEACAAVHAVVPPVDTEAQAQVGVRSDVAAVGEQVGEDFIRCRHVDVHRAGGAEGVDEAKTHAAH